MENENMTKEQLLEQINALQETINSLEKTVAAQRQTKDALRASEKNLSDILEKNADGIVIVDAEGVVLYVNPAAEKLFGKRKEDFLGYLFGFPVSADKAVDSLVIRKGDTLCDVELRVVQVQWQKRPAFQLSVRDITERKRMEEVLGENQARLALALQSASMGVWHWDIIENRRYFDEQVCHLMGINPARFTGAAEEFFGVVHPDDRETIKAALARTLEHDVLYEPEYRVVWPDGSVHFITARGRLIRDNKGQPMRIIGILWDITERKKAEEELTFRNILLSSQQEASIDGILVVDENNTIISYNRRFVEMMGIPQELVENKSDEPVLRFVTERMADPQQFLRRVQYLYEHRRETSREELVLKDGRIFDRYSSPMFGSGNRYYGRVWYFRDISERKKAEEEIRKSEAKYRSIIEASPVPYALNDDNQNITFLNRAFIQTFGYTLEDIPTLADWWPKAYSDREYRQKVATIWQARLEKAKLTGDAFEPMELNIQCKNGIVRSVMASAASLQSSFEGTHLVILYDITERKQLELSLKEEKTFTENALNNLNDIFFVFDLEGRFLRWNKTVNKVSGYEDGEIVSMKPTDFFRGADVDRFATAIQTAIKNGSAGVVVELATKDGRQIPYEITGSLLKDSKGNPIGISGVGRDIVERKRAEEALRNSEKKYRKLVDNAPIGIYKASFAGRFLYVNKALATMVEFMTPEEMMAENVLLRYKNPEDRVVFLAELKKNGKVDNFELDTLSKTGKTIHLLLNSTLEGDTISGIVLNVTEQKKLETQLRHAQKMEAIGMLAGGIAHDFNNILNVIMGYGSMVLDSIGSDSPSKGHMNEVLAAADRAANLTQRLLAFSRKQVVEMKPVNINETILGIEKMLSRLIGEDIVFSTELTGKKMTVMADSGQIEQVLMNLVTNARDAMPKGGRMTISTGIKKIDDEYITAYGYGRTGKYALISVTDTGSGMDAETQKKIFEPFFTTKGVGEGTGLGLSIIYGIIKQHNGYIKVYSEEGKGTTFKILLPLIEEETSKGQEVEAVVRIKGGTETILVAEDDASLRKLSRLVLESVGYNVITAEDGEDAISKYIENRDKIQLVILDMIMPNKSGKEAYNEIRKISPAIKTLFASGYTMDIIHRKELLDEGMDFILKPVSSKDLLKKVREVLDR